MARTTKLMSMSVESLMKLRDDIGLPARLSNCKVSLPLLAMVAG